MKLKVIFAGTPDFAVPTLQGLLTHHNICAVYTKPDSPTGRGRKILPGPVKKYVQDHFPEIPIFQPISLKDPLVQKQLADFHADVMVVVAYGLILPKVIFPLTKYGYINVHASLLPRWRGAAPIQRALLAGDSETGVTIMQIDEGLDTGDMLSHKNYCITANETAQSLQDHLARLGAEALLETLVQLQNGNIIPEPQDNHFATYAAKIKKEEALIDWNQPAEIIERTIRAFNPWPVTHTYLNGQLLKVWQAEKISDDAQTQKPGTIIEANAKGIVVAAKSGAVRLLVVQSPGGKPVNVSQFLNGRAEIIHPNKTVLAGAC